MTRPIRASTEPAPQSEVRADARLTRWMLRAWPLLSALALILALFGRSWFVGDRDTSASPRAAPAAREAARPSPSGPAARASEPAPEPARPLGRPSSAASATDAPTTLATGQGSLSVNATPWAEVKLDGRAVGVTPLRKLKLRAGSHVLALACPPLGRDTTLKLEVKPGQSARVVVDLSRDPPRTFLDGVSEAR